jgi:Ca-activated chloride channel family protein
VRKAAWLLCLTLLAGFEPLRRPNPLVEQGNRAYREKRYEAALDLYRRAQQGLPENADLTADVGTALLALGRTDEAIRTLREAARKGAGAKAHYNLGNAYLKGQRFPEAIDAYRRALRADPGDEPAKWNLELALRMKEEQERKQEQKQQEQQQQQQKQEQQQDQQQQQQEEPRQQEQAQRDPDPSRGDRQEQQEQDAEERQRRAPETIDEAESARQAVLDAIERNEKNLQVERLRTLHRRRRVVKDW